MERINIRYTGITETGIIIQRKNKSYLVNYPCNSSTICSPYEVTLKPGFYHIECWGASGYDQLNNYSLGCVTSGRIKISITQTFYVYIGAMGVKSSYPSYNGGGSGSSNGFSGGGSTDIRITDGHYSEFVSLLSRIMVAGGGGGHNMWKSDENIKYFGGRNNADGIFGGDGIIKQTSPESVDIPLAKGGTQTNGGLGAFCISPCYHGNKTNEADGKFGMGGNATNVIYAAGGGGGYFGGGAGHVDSSIVGGGGGGSSYISGFKGCISVSPSSTEENIFPSSSSIHFSGHKFSLPSMDMISFGNGQFSIVDITDSSKIFCITGTISYSIFPVLCLFMIFLKIS